MLALHCRAYGLPEPALEHKFHPTRGWLLDAAWLDRKLAVEVEGGIWSKAGGKPCQLCGQAPKGAHGRGKGILRDMEKANALAEMGWALLRFTPQQVSDGDAILVLRRILSRERVA